ncbi:MAG TPA: hypothetical protein VF941_04190, partial [Clostridia bacterium]
MGEPDKPISIDWIKDFSFCKNAEFIKPKEVNVYCGFIDSQTNEQKYEKIEVKNIINFDGLYLVEELVDEENWQMGQVDPKGDIYCWGYYGAIKEAIRGL